MSFVHVSNHFLRTYSQKLNYLTTFKWSLLIIGVSSWKKDIDLQFHQEYVRDEISPNHQLPEHETDE